MLLLCVYVCVYLCASVCVLPCVCLDCFSNGLLSLLLLVYATDFPEIMKSARSCVTPLTNSILSSRTLDTSLASATFLLARYYRPDTLRQIRDVLIATLGA